MEENKENKNAEGKKKLDPDLALNTLSNLYNRYVSLQEIKKERERIQADKEETLKQIEATKDLLMTYLNRSFDERALIFKKNFEAMDAAIANNNMEALAITVQSINSLAAKSPFRDLIDIAQVKHNLLNSSEIEI